jgi:hypothetical protein
VVNCLALTCKFLVCHCWEGPKTATGAYGTCCKPAHTVHVVINFNFNFNTTVHEVGMSHRTSWKPDAMSTGRGVVSKDGGMVGWCVRVAFAVQSE